MCAGVSAQGKPNFSRACGFLTFSSFEAFCVSVCFCLVRYHYCLLQASKQSRKQARKRSALISSFLISRDIGRWAGRFIYRAVLTSRPQIKWTV